MTSHPEELSQDRSVSKKADIPASGEPQCINAMQYAGSSPVAKPRLLGLAVASLLLCGLQLPWLYIAGFFVFAMASIAIEAGMSPSRLSGLLAEMASAIVCLLPSLLAITLGWIATRRGATVATQVIALLAMVGGVLWCLVLWFELWMP